VAVNEFKYVGALIIYKLLSFNFFLSFFLNIYSYMLKSIASTLLFISFRGRSTVVLPEFEMTDDDHNGDN
jgi:hypothetical protein